MPTLLFYILKLSLSLAVVYLFYQFVLRRLTFYNANRWYLFGYSVLSFFMAMINITPLLERSHTADSGLVQIIPVVHHFTTEQDIITQQGAATATAAYNQWDLVAAVLLTGMALLLLRFIIRYLSFKKITRHARLVSADGVKLYEVDAPIIPFSFGNAVFVNSRLHSATELQEIIRHEFVHVKQRHTIDILWAELLCMLNWYNPFAWLLKKAIRQNLEFIADHNVLENGIDKKQYQYLLLKVIGNNQFSIAPKFNFSSLKKRIAMMNKMKSAGVHLVKFLFILPLVVVLLLAFRSKGDQLPAVNPFIPVVDTVPDKGYHIQIREVNGKGTVTIRDRNNKLVEQMDVQKWYANEKYYKELYGVPDTPKAPLAPNAVETVLTKTSAEFEITDTKAVIKLKDGKTEVYDLTKPSEKEKFENKYGSIEEPPVPPGGADMAAPTPVAEVPGVPAVAAVPGVPAVADVPGVPAVSGTLGAPVAAPPVPGDVTDAIPVPPDPRNHIITGKEDIIVIISNKTTAEELKASIEQMKAKGVELEFSEISHNDKGFITFISGTMKAGESKSSFSASEFKSVILAMVRKDGRVYFKINVKDPKESRTESRMSEKKTTVI